MGPNNNKKITTYFPLRFFSFIWRAGWPRSRLEWRENESGQLSLACCCYCGLIPMALDCFLLNCVGLLGGCCFWCIPFFKWESEQMPNSSGMREDEGEGKSRKDGKIITALSS